MFNNMKTEKLSKLIFILSVLFLLSVNSAKATILWVGGEEMDFPNGNLACTTTAAGYRSGYGRAAVYACTNGTIAKGSPFSAGGITSGWISAVYRYWNPAASSKFFGFGKSGTNDGLFLGISASNSLKIALWKYDGTTWTELAAQASTSFSNGPIYKLDMQIINYGVSGTVNIYVDQGSTPVLSYTGDIRAGSSTDLDSIFLAGGNSSGPFSELIASDSDTRLLSLVTLVPNGAGDSNQWSGVFSDIDEISINDADNIASATSGENFQCNLSNLPTGNFNIHGVKISARGTTTGTGASSISLGVKTNGAISVQSPVPQSPVWSFFDTTMFSVNPITSTNWTPTEINALQINVQSAP